MSRVERNLAICFNGQLDKFVSAGYLCSPSMKPRRHCLHLSLMLMSLWALAIMPAASQWLVYELQLTPQEDSVNFDTYKAGYLMVPAKGGVASLVLIDEAQRRYAGSESCGKFFSLFNPSQQRAAFSALAIHGQSQALYAASGALDRSLVLATPGNPETVVRVAEFLQGGLLVADDESDRGPAADGSLGVMGGAIIEGRLREDLSSVLSAQFGQPRSAFAHLVELLEKYGYSPDDGSAQSLQSPTSSAGVDASLFPVESLPRQQP
jgi:hypothetical protein